MNRIGFPSLLILLFLLQGCAQLQKWRNAEEAFSLSPIEAADKADQLVEEERWGEAITLLQKAQQTYTDSPVLQKRAWDIRNTWEDIRNTLEQRILVVEAEALIKRLSLTETIQKGEPDSYVTKTRVLFWKQVLKQKQPGLMSCADYQANRRLDLSIQCLELAATIEPTEEIEQRLTELKAIENQSTTVSTKASVSPKLSQTTSVNPARTEQVKAMLVSAMLAVEQNDYLKAVGELKQATAIQPESKEHWNDIESLQQKIDEHITGLIHQGEVYYGYDQLEQAVSTWEKVLILDPDRHDISERINRARKVLIKYEALKKQQENEVGE